MRRFDAFEIVFRRVEHCGNPYGDDAFGLEGGVRAIITRTRLETIVSKDAKPTKPRPQSVLEHQI